MKIDVLFFASLRERLGVGHCQVELDEGQTIADMLEHLGVTDGNWQKAFEGPLLSSVNQDMVPMDTVLQEGDEVGLFPPVTGG